MNLFRSEEHVRNWSGFKADTQEGIITLSDLLRLFSADLFTRRLDPDYISKRRYVGQFLRDLAVFGESHPFWSPPTP